MNPENNLDYLAAHHAQVLVNEALKDSKKVAKDLENSLTKALGVLQEHGVYACFLYLYAREKDFGKTIVGHICRLLADMQFQGVPAQDAAEPMLAFVRDLTGRLPDLLLAREALEQMLIYARYGAKAKADQKE